VTTPSQRDLSTAFTREMATYLGGGIYRLLAGAHQLRQDGEKHVAEYPTRPVPPPLPSIIAQLSKTAMRNGYWTRHSVLPPFSRLCFRLGSYSGIGYAVSYHFALGLVFPLVKQFASRLPDRQFHGTENNTHHRWQFLPGKQPPCIFQ
jgi:hypothetical protein